MAISDIIPQNRADQLRRQSLLCSWTSSACLRQSLKTFLFGQWDHTTECGTVTMTTERSKNGAITLYRMNFSGYVGHVTIFS